MKFDGLIKRVLISFICALLLPVGSAHAFGLGEATVESDLGRPLEVSVALLNVSQGSSLTASVDTEMFGQDPDKRLKAELVGSAAQTRIRVFTDWPMLEPYIRFNLQVTDGLVTQAKDYVMLLEFRPSGATTNDPLRVRNDNVASAIDTEPQVQIRRITPSAAAAGSIMGPYEWAQEGQIPEQFGAVLDGQSLWRVARRINKAMGVSVEQMMLALFEANPDAFSNGAIDGLIAGSYLQIPSQQSVQAVSANQAKARVDALSSARSPNFQSAPVSDAAADVQQPAAEGEQPAEDQPQGVETIDVTPEPLFVVGQQSPNEDIDGANSQGSVESSGGQGQQEIIDSLSKTIGDLMRDNVDKEQRLLAMDERLKALETTLDSVGLSVLENASQASKPSDQAAVTDQQTESDEGVSAQVPQEAAEPQIEDEGGIAWWVWILPIVIAIGLWLFFRARQSMRSPEEDLFVESTEEIEAPTVYVSPENIEGPSFEEYVEQPDYSDMRSNQAQSVDDYIDDGEVEGISYQEIEAEFANPDPQLVQTLSEHTIEFDTTHASEFSFNSAESELEKIDIYLENEDYDGARAALDAARGDEIDEPNYHYQRLRILLAKNDENGFYEYFNLVEDKFEDADQDLKLDVANLVARLNVDS